MYRSGDRAFPPISAPARPPSPRLSTLRNHTPQTKYFFASEGRAARRPPAGHGARRGVRGRRPPGAGAGRALPGRAGRPLPRALAAGAAGAGGGGLGPRRGAGAGRGRWDGGGVSPRGGGGGRGGGRRGGGSAHHRGGGGGGELRREAAERGDGAELRRGGHGGGAEPDCGGGRRRRPQRRGRGHRHHRCAGPSSRPPPGPRPRARLRPSALPGPAPAPRAPREGVVLSREISRTAQRERRSALGRWRVWGGHRHLCHLRLFAGEERRGPARPPEERADGDGGVCVRAQGRAGRPRTSTSSAGRCSPGRTASGTAC